MNIPCLQAHSHILPDEPLNSASGLEIEFKCAAQIRRPYPRCGYTNTSVNKRNPSGPGRKAVTQVRGQSHEPLSVRGEFCASEQFQPELRVALVPMALAPRMAKHATIRE